MEIYNYHFAKSKELVGAIFEDNGYFHACTAIESSHTFKTKKRC